MFSSNSFPNLSSSNYHHFQTLLSSSSGGTDNINTALFLNPNHHHDQLPCAFLPSSNPRIINDSSFINIALPENVAASTSNRQNTNTLAGGYFGHSNFVPGKRPVKKDRHSKICTAQGLRDRRVRLSIEIAREFFDLQDMLGFDKASTTLGWLLKKSKKAIRELIQRKNSCNDGGRGKKKCSTLISECETMAENGSEEGGSDFIGAPEKLRKSAFQIVAKASRDKARARARQRTREKMCTRIKLNDQISRTQMLMTTQLRSNNDSNHDNNNSNTDNNNNNNQSNINMEYSTLKLVEEPSSQPQPDHGHLHRHHHQVPMEDIIEESILLRRKLNFASSLSATYQQSNLGLTSKDENRENYSLGLPQNWDINSAIAHSTFRAITNMNLSGGLQICGKTWDARN